MILLNQVVQIFQGPYFGPLAVPMFVEDFARRPMGRLVPGFQFGFFANW